MIITLQEIFRLLVMTLAVGYIFSDLRKYDPLQKGISWEGISIGILAATPGVILHELAHKFVAIAYGLKAEFFASYIGLGIGIVLKLISSPFLVFVPGYVSITGASPLTSAVIALAGPLTNGLLWLISFLLLKSKKTYSTKTTMILILNKKINGILFIFNLIPIPPFDGGQAAFSLINYFSA